MGISKDNDRLTIIINKELKTKLEQIAKQDNRSTSNYVASLLEEHIEAKSPPKKLHIRRVKSEDNNLPSAMNRITNKD